MTRIRYRKSESGDLASVQPVLVSHDMVTVVINPELFTFMLVGSNGQDILASGEGTTLGNTQALVKEALKDLGAAFGDERRATREQRSL